MPYILNKLSQEHLEIKHSVYQPQPLCQLIFTFYAHLHLSTRQRQMHWKVRPYQTPCQVYSKVSKQELAFSALTLLVGQQEGHMARKKNMRGWWRWALVSPDERHPAGWSVCLPPSVNLPLHHKVQKFSSGTGSPGWSRKKGRKTVVW